MERLDRLRLFQPQLRERLGIVEEAVDDRRHRHAEDVGAVVRDPRALGDIGEVVDAGKIAQRHQLALLEQGERGVEGAAGDKWVERSVGKEGVRSVRFSWSPCITKKNKTHIIM